MRITAGTAYYGSYDMQFADCVAALNERFPEVKTVGIRNCSYIDQAKSTILTKHMDDSDVIVLVDHDMIFEPESLLMIAESAMEANAVTAAAYCTRGQSMRTIMGFAAPPLTFFEGGGRVEATGLAGGFMAVPTRVLRDMAAHYKMQLCQTTTDAMAYPFQHCICEDGKWWGEDLSFCWRLRDMGEKFYLDTRIRVGHKGSYVYQIEDALTRVPILPSISIGHKGEFK